MESQGKGSEYKDDIMFVTHKLKFPIQASWAMFPKE